MKLFTAIASAAVIGASFLVPNSAEAQRAPNGWIYVGKTNSSGSTYYVKPLGCNGSYCTFINRRHSHKI